MARLKEFYKKEVVPLLMKKFGYRNVMQVPKLEKIVINVGLGEAVQNIKAVDHAVEDIMTITGQRPIVTRAKRPIASFKLKKGMPIGVKVTLRGDRMYEFFDRLVNIAIPRMKDFRGLPTKSFDGRGNYTLGVREQIIFPEINYDKIDKIRGFNVTIVTTAETDEEAKELLKLMGFPFRKD